MRFLRQFITILAVLSLPFLAFADATYVPTTVNEMDDVNTTGIATGKILKWNATTSKWEMSDDAGEGSGAPTDATYITQTANGSLSAEQALSGLTTGLVKVTNGTGVLSTASAGTDYAAALGADDNYVTDAEKAALHAAGSDDTFTVANEATDTTCFPLFATAATGDLGAKTNAGLTYNSSTGLFSVGGIALGAGNLTMTGSLAATGARVTKGWFTDIESTNIPTVGGTALLTSLTAPQFTSIELGHASDTTLARVSAGVVSIEGVNVVTTSSTDTLTNKRITPRIVTTTDDATAVIDVDVTDQYQLTAVANATEFSTTGTPTAGQKLIIRFKDAGVAKAITWNAVFTANGVALPTTTTAGKTTYCGFIYNATDSKFNLVASTTEA